jgi:hypothetical protein
VGLRAGLDTEARRQILCLCRGSNLRRPVVLPVARLTELEGSRRSTMGLEKIHNTSQAIGHHKDIRIKMSCDSD